MRGLVITDEIKQKIKDQVAWAEKPENWYYPELDPKPPGDKPKFVMHLEVGYRVVYTLTAMTKGKFRHISISVPSSKYPHQVAAFTIATMFGFTGGGEVEGMTLEPGKDWMMHVNKNEHCIVIAQEVPR